MQGCLEEDFAALRKLRDDDASGALKKLFELGAPPFPKNLDTTYR